MKKYLYVGIMLFIMIVLMNSCFSYLNDYIIAEKGGLRKWSRSKTPEESQQKNVFGGYYYAEPFVYSDSVFQMELHFNNVWSEYWHYYNKTGDSLYTIDHLYLFVEVDTTKPMNGLYRKFDTAVNEYDDGRRYFWYISAAAMIEYNNRSILFPNEYYTDTFPIPIYLSHFYYKTIGKPDAVRKRIGEILFIRKDSVETYE